MCSLGLNEGELRGQMANPGSPGKMAVKTEHVCVYTYIYIYIYTHRERTSTTAIAYHSQDHSRLGWVC